MLPLTSVSCVCLLSIKYATVCRSVFHRKVHKCFLPGDRSVPVDHRMPNITSITRVTELFRPPAAAEACHHRPSSNPTHGFRTGEGRPTAHGRGQSLRACPPFNHGRSPLSRTARLIVDLSSFASRDKSFPLQPAIFLSKLSIRGCIWEHIQNPQKKPFGLLVAPVGDFRGDKP
jgi:hypothetical protein